jgi:excisionase family DNA binding protein
MSDPAKDDLLELPRRVWLLPSQVAEYLNVSSRKVRRLVEDGKLIGWKPGKKSMRILRASVIALIQEAISEYQEAHGIFFDSEDSTDHAE